MKINFSAWAIRNPVPPILLFVVLCLLGFMSFMTLPVTKFPNIDIPVVSVSVTQGGATPAELHWRGTRQRSVIPSGCPLSAPAPGAW